jgi:hypothetical protein
MSDADIELTRWTIRLALAAVAGRWSIALWLPDQGRRHERLARGLWTLGCVLLWVHVACAFEFHHHWSHAEAVASTAGRTRDTIGIEWGGGIFFNYAMMLVWTADCAWWWLRPLSYRARSPRLALALHGFLAFMIVNAAVVFESGAIRWFAIGGAILLAAGWLWRRHTSA